MKASTLAKLTEITRDDYLIALNDPAGSPAGRAVEWGLISGELGQARLKADTSAGATTCSLDTLPKGTMAQSGWLVFDPYTTQCEIRKWTGGAKTAPTFAALSYAHSKDDSVLFVSDNTVNVLWFGAKGDGTTDDVTALQAAIDSVGEGGTVLIPRGTYLLSASLEIADNAFSMVGQGFGSELKLGGTAPNGTRILEVTGDKFLVSDLFLNGNYSARGATAGASVIFNSCADWSITDCKITSAGFDSVAGWNALRGSIRGNHIEGGTDSGIDLVEGSKDIAIVGNIVVATADTKYPIALDTANVGTYGLISRVSVVGNIVIAGAANVGGICLESVQQCIISGNTVYVPTVGIGIWLYSDGIDNCVNGNTVYLLNGSGTTYGIDLNDQNNDEDKLSCPVIGNIVRGTSSSRNVGIHAYYTGAHLTGNHVRNVATGIRTEHGNKVGLVYVLTSNVVQGCNVNYSFDGAHSNKATVYATDNLSHSKVTYDWATDGGCDIFWRGQRLDKLVCYGLYVGRVQGDVQFVAEPATGTWGVGDRIYNAVPQVGVAKSWVCTVAGTPGTWVSEGSL